MKAGLLQYDPAYLRVKDNLDAVERHLTDADADLMVLPELFATGYFFQSRADLESVAETVPGGPTSARLRTWSAETGTVFIAGLPERDGENIYNSAVVVAPSGVAGTYRKMHLFDREKTLFTPGDRGFPVFDVTARDGRAYRVGVMICFDWYFPEAARSLALNGADVIAHPSNLVRKDCPRAMPIRALENHVFTITANRFGSESHGGERLTYIGQSLICSPEGDVLFVADRTGDVLGIVGFDPQLARRRKITTHNDLFADRRPAAYRALSALGNAVEPLPHAEATGTDRRSQRSSI